MTYRHKNDNISGGTNYSEHLALYQDIDTLTAGHR
jgi:hypothetical protein